MEGLNFETSSHLINTKGHCFLCLKWIVSEGNYTQPIKSLCRYLNLKVEDSISNLDFKQKLDFEVNLCLECNKIVSKVSELYQFLEVIKMELDYWVESVSKAISGSEEDIKGKMNFREDMKDEGHYLRVTNKLRMMLLDKYSIKSERRKPTVLVDRLKLKESKGQAEMTTAATTPLSTADINQIKENLIFLPDTKNVKCRKCEKIFSRKDTFETHFESVHLKIKYECEFCGKQVGQKTRFYTHRKQCKANQNHDKLNDSGLIDNPNEGQIDFKRTKENGILLKENAISLKESKRVRCKQCRKVFSRRSAFEAHFQSVHLKVKFQCEYCGKRVGQITRYYTHRKQCRIKYGKCNSLDKRGAEKLSKCKYCYVGFKYLDNLNKHLRVCSKQSGCVQEASVPEADPLASVLETATFQPQQSTQEQLKANLIPIGGGESVRCKLCRAVFINIQTFKCHFDSVHLGVRYTCPFCYKEFRQLAGMYNHRAICKLNDRNGGGERLVNPRESECVKDFKRESDLEFIAVEESKPEIEQVYLVGDKVDVDFKLF